MMAGGPSILVTALLCGAGGLLLIATIAFFALRSVRPSGSPDNARGILDRRLAAGEIEVEEYYERESALRSANPPPRRRRA